MSEISRSALFGKLNSLSYKAIEGATVFCKLRGNPYVELVHWLQQILQTPDSDFHRIVRHFEIDQSRLARDVVEALDRLPRGASSISDLSAHVENAVERGWVYATLMFGENRVRTGHLAVGMVKTPSLRNALIAISRQFENVKSDALTEDFSRIVNGSPEERLGATDGSSSAGPGEASDAMAPAQMGKQEALKRFATNLTEKARKGEIDPVSGRDEEIRQIVDILMRRRQNNPILTGEAGVGKTAVVEGFALRLARGDVPPPLQNVSLLHTRHRAPAGRREHEGRVRESVAAGDRRGAGLAQADHPVRGRGPYADRRRRGSRNRRCREPAQARAGAGHVAHDRRDHVGRIQEVHREGPGAHTTFPGGEDRGAERGQSDPHGPGRGVHSREASSGAGAGRGPRSSRAPLASLYPGAPAARQGGQPARYGVRPGGHQPARRAAAARRLPPAHRGAADGDGDHRPGGNRRHQRRRAPKGRAREAGSERAAARGARGAVERGARPGGARPRDSRQVAQGQRTRGGHGQQAGAGGGGAEERCRRPGAGSGHARGPAGAAGRARRITDEALVSPGRVAADSAQRRRAGCRVGRAGLDRRAGRPHGEERDRDGA